MKMTSMHLWEQSQSFQPKGRGKSYSLVLPPPNANGDLHLGHALLVAVEDIAMRYHRLKGDRTVFIPGADHAGFETWVVYEKNLAKRGSAGLILPGNSYISKYGIS